MAGIGRDDQSGAGPGALGEPGLLRSGGGPLGELARAQYGAMVRLRWEMFRAGLRSIHGILDLGATGIAWMIYAFLGIGLGVGLCMGAYSIISAGEWRLLPVLFWVLFFVWQAIPIMLASYQEQFDLGILLRFPVHFGSYYVLYLVFGLLDISTILGAVACLGLWIGVALARPALLPWTTLALAGFAVFNILLVRTVFAWIERWLAQRRTREILGALFMVSLLSLQLMNPALYQKRHGHQASTDQRAEQLRQMETRFKPLLKQAHGVQQWLPPGLAAEAVLSGAQPDPLGPITALDALGLYAILVGGLLALRLKAEYRGENLGAAPARVKAASGAGRAVIPAALPDRSAPGLAGSSPIAAIMEKDMRCLLRTLPLLYAIGAPLVLVLVFSGLFIHNGSAGTPVFPLSLPICMVYAQLGFTQIFYNSLGAEGAGIQLYFLSPTPIRTVLLAKNLLHAALFLLVALVAALLAGLRLGFPDGSVLAATAAWVLFSLPCNLAAGNIFSLKMPYRINPGRITRQRGSQASALLSLLLQLGILAISGVVFALSWSLGRVWIAVPIFLILAAGAVFVWSRVLSNARAMADERRDDLIATLMKAD